MLTWKGAHMRTLLIALVALLLLAFPAGATLLIAFVALLLLGFPAGARP